VLPQVRLAPAGSRHTEASSQTEGEQMIMHAPAIRVTGDTCRAALANPGDTRYLINVGQ